MVGRQAGVTDVYIQAIRRMMSSAAAKSRQSCPTLCDPTDGRPTGSPVPGILQARTLEWVAISFSSAWKWKVKVKLLSRVRPSATPWTAAYQAPPSIGFSRQEYWSGMPLPSPMMSSNLGQSSSFYRMSLRWHSPDRSREGYKIEALRWKMHLILLT